MYGGHRGGEVKNGVAREGGRRRGGEKSKLLTKLALKKVDASMF